MFNPAARRPLISVILAVCNESAYIERSLRSLMAQQALDFDLQILVVDGASTDGTTKIVDKLVVGDPRVQHLYNPQRKTPFAFNIGLRASQGEYVCILGAHTQYAPDYIAVCLRELHRSGAIGCSGRVVTCPASDHWQARLVARALSHPFGTSRNSTRTQREGFVDTIPYPLFVRQALLDIGGYDEQLFRNQDNDMNQRLRARGHKLYLTEKTSAHYFVKPTLASLIQYAYLTGFWNLISFRKNKSAMSTRHFVPFAFALVLALGLTLASTSLLEPQYRFWLLLPITCVLAVHLGLGSAFALLEWMTKRDATSLLLPGAWLGLHTAYGCGTLVGLLRNSKPTQVAARHVVGPELRETCSDRNS
jgi:glycosyltransferase involved in cell wall biosynthesis